MPGTVSHALSMTTPDDPAYENKPSDWNRTHAVTLNAVGSEISGAFGNGGGVSFGLSADGKVTGSYTVPASSQLTGVGGISLSTNGSTISISGNHIGLATAQTNVTWTANSNGISLNAGGYAGTSTGFTGANISGSMTHNTSGLALSLSVAAPGAAAESNAHNLLGANTAGNTTASGSTIGLSGLNLTLSGTNASQIVISAPATSSLAAGANITISTAGSTITIIGATVAPGAVNFSAGTTSSGLGSVVFSNSNGVSFGLNGSTITATVATNYQSQGAYLTTAMLSNAATISNIRLSAGTTSNLASAFTFADSNGISFGLNAGTITGTVKTDYLTTAMLSNAATISNIKISAGTLSANRSDVTFSNANGITFGLETNGVVTASHNALTTARASTDAIGLNTAQTNVTWTANSSGLSINAAGYAGTTTGFTGANISGSMTHNSVGLAMSLSVAAPGAGAENNWHHALGANTAGNTTASGSTIGLSGINLTISGTNASVMNLSVPATSSLVGENNITISTAGSTITIANAYQSYYELVDGVMGTTALPAQGASTVLVQPFMLPYPMSMSYVRVPMSVGHVQTSSGTTANRTWSLQQFETWNIGFYSLGTGASSRSLQYVGGSTAGITFSKVYQVGAASNNQSCSYSASIPTEGTTTQYTTSFGVNSASMVLHTTILSNSIVGAKWLDIPFGSTLSAGPWWVAIQRSTTTGSTSAGGNWVNITAAKQDVSIYGVSQVNVPVLPWGVNTSASTGAAWQVGLGGWTTNTNGFTSSSMALSHILSTANHPQIPMVLVRQA